MGNRCIPTALRNPVVRWLVLILVCAGLAVGVLHVLRGSGTGALEPQVTLRQALANELIDDPAIVDEVTPMPPIEGRAVLFVDGTFYMRAAPNVVEYVCQAARAGIAAVVVGPGFQDLCQRLGVGYTIARYRSGDESTDAPIAVSVVKLYPGYTVDGHSVSAETQIAGDASRPSKAISEALAWIGRRACEPNPTSAAPWHG